MESNKIWKILGVFIVSFFIAWQFSDDIVQFLFLPLSEAIRENGDFELITTTALGGHFRMAIKSSLFMAFVVSILFINKSIAFSFYVSAIVVYILNKLVIAQWYMTYIESQVINLEYYLDFILSCTLIGGTIGSFIFYKLTKVKQHGKQQRNKIRRFFHKSNCFDI